MSVLLLSDLHLPDSPSPLRDTFLRFLAGPARQADAVYILGDLFNYWIGDDIGLEQYAAEAAALTALTASGVPVHFTGGNRDFFLGRKFFAATGVIPLPDPFILDLGGSRTLLSHGDLYCTDDVALQRWRKFSSNRTAQRIFEALPLSLRRNFALRMRKGSKRAAVTSRPGIMDVNADAIVCAFTDTGVDRMIHGHTHRPAIHAVTAGGRHCERIVLSDWHDGHAEYLECDGAGFTRKQVAPESISDEPATRAREKPA